MDPRPYGDSFVLALRKYLHDNHLTNLGQINNAEIIADLAQRFQDHWQEQQKQRKKRGDATPEEIAIYEAYPRKVARGDALGAIRAALTKVSYETLLEKTRHFEVCVGRWPKTYRFKEGSDLCPYPATWFNKERWTDSEKEWMPAGMYTREDDPTDSDGTSQGRSPRPTLLEPEGWAEEFPKSVYKTWAEVPQDSRRAICDHMNKVRA